MKKLLLILSLLALPAMGYGTDGEKPWYEILGVAPDASTRELKHARDYLALKYHTDKTGSADHTDIAAINTAFETGKKEAPENARLFSRERAFFITAGAIIAATATGIYAYNKKQDRDHDIEQIKQRTDLDEDEKTALIALRSQFAYTYLPTWLLKLFKKQTDWDAQ